MGREYAKKLAARDAVDRLSDGMVVGLGSGSTAEYAIEWLGECIAGDELDVVGVPTSMQAREVAQDAGVPVRELAEVDGVDIGIDGADQVVGQTVVKGGGGAHAREQVVAREASTVVVVVDEAKLATELTRSIPVEVLANTQTVVDDAISGLGGEARVRPNRNNPGPFVTDNGGFVLDCDFGVVAEPGKLAVELNAIPGVISHGLCVDFIDEIVVGEPSGNVRRERF